MEKRSAVGFRGASIPFLVRPSKATHPSLALLFELADGGAGTVSLQHVQQAAAWYLAAGGFQSRETRITGTAVSVTATRFK
jgi:hypothetical protein